MLFLPFYLWTLTVAFITQSSLDFFQPLWVLVAVLYVVEQTFSVRKGGWRAVLVSLAVVPEIFLDVFLNIIYVMSFYGALFATDEACGSYASPRRHGVRSARTATERVRAPSGFRSARHSRQTQNLAVLVLAIGLGALRDRGLTRGGGAPAD